MKIDITAASQSSPASGKNSPLSVEKRFANDFIDRNSAAFNCLSDSIFYFGELGMQEHRSCELMTGLLEEHGFAIDRNLAGFPTGFLASYGSGAPVIAMHCEYDSNPRNSQRSGVAVKDEIVPGAPGHCEGHNVNASVLVTSAIAIRYAMEKYGIQGTLKVFGAPAEEQLISRPYFIRDGLFDDVDMAFHAHILDRFGTDYGLLQNASISADFVFHGESAHAAMWPERARDALDALVLMDMGVAQYREHMLKSMTAHRVITHGGDQPNVIPALTSVWWYFRDSTAEGARRLFEQAKKIAEGAALMTNCTVDVSIRSAVWPVLGNQVMAQVIQKNIETVGQPEWNDDEERLARELQTQAGVVVDGLRTGVAPLSGPSKQIPASNDAGDVSWKVPMARLWFPANVPHIPFHHWSGGAVLASSIAHKGGLAGAKALALSCLDFFLHPNLVEDAKASFRADTGSVVYKSLIPEGLKPPLDLNKKMMDQYRPAMEAHYLQERPVFAV